jgi:hypothetical protein
MAIVEPRHAQREPVADPSRLGDQRAVRRRATAVVRGDEALARLPGAPVRDVDAFVLLVETRDENDTVDVGPEKHLRRPGRLPPEDHATNAARASNHERLPGKAGQAIAVRRPGEGAAGKRDERLPLLAQHTHVFVRHHRQPPAYRPPGCIAVHVERGPPVRADDPNDRLALERAVEFELLAIRRPRAHADAAVGG